MANNIKNKDKKEYISLDVPQYQKLDAIRRYYNLVIKGSSPERTRKDIGLSIEDIETFDFKMFSI